MEYVDIIVIILQPVNKGASTGKEKGARRGGGAREGDAERAIQQTMKEYQKYVL